MEKPERYDCSMQHMFLEGILDWKGKRNIIGSVWGWERERERASEHKYREMLTLGN